MRSRIEWLPTAAWMCLTAGVVLALIIGRSDSDAALRDGAIAGFLMGLGVTVFIAARRMRIAISPPAAQTPPKIWQGCVMALAGALFVFFGCLGTLSAVLSESRREPVGSLLMEVVGAGMALVVGGIVLTITRTVKRLRTPSPPRADAEGPRE